MDIRNPLILSKNENYQLAKEKRLNIDNAVRKIANREIPGNPDSVIGFTFVEDDKGQLDTLSEKYISMKHPITPKYGWSKIDMIEIAILDSERIHILGSKEDIGSFKKFIDDSKTQYEVM